LALVDLENTTDPSRDTKVYCNPSRPCLSLPGPNGTRRFEFMLHDGEEDAGTLAPENVASLLRLYGTDDTASIRRKVVYTFHARIADRWRAGRIFLAGDAAHLMPPFAGQGMNSGIRDAHNLAWKIAAVASGHLGERVLDTYEAERRRHAAEMIEMAIRVGHVMMPRNRVQAFALQMKYKPKPRFHQGFLLDPEATTPNRSFVGKLFPQALVMTARGYQLLDDVLGDGFALLAPPGTSPKLLDAVELQSGAASPIRRVAVLDKEDASPVETPTVAARDLRGDLAKLLHGHPVGLFLLRPDRYVAGFFGADNIRSAARDIGKLFDQTWHRPATAATSAAQAERPRSSARA
jgi:3-(3-hydroxy-phenyl)propionate hydroxylase